MADEAKAGGGVDVAEEPARGWRPSRRPQHHVDEPVVLTAPIVERSQRGGLRGVLRDLLKLRFAKLIIGLGIFILGAIVYDATVNFGAWTERKAKPKATQHKGIERAPDMPD